MSFHVDIPSTEDVLAAALASSLPPVPPQEQHYASALIQWWETGPGEVYIHAEGGTADDRHYGSTLVAIELQVHGYRRGQFDLDVIHPDSGRNTSKTSSWPDLMAKAKRLIQSGQVQVLRNGFNYIVGHVVGDHGEYDTEISRDNPESRQITGWQCSCPWDQYAWQRTRKWKKFEGRPCSHVMALYWKALSTPLDEQLSEDQANAMGTGQKLPAPAVADHPPEIEQNIEQGENPAHDKLPKSFGPEGDIIQGDQMQMNLPPDAIGGPPGPAQAPLSPPPSQGPEPSGIIPPFPMEQMQMEWKGPGTTPGGGVSPPGAYSVPGAKPPNTPPNPIQMPGTYSATEFQPPQIVRLKNPMYGIAEGPEPGQFGDGEYREVPAGSSGEVLSQDASTGWVEVIVPLDGSGYHQPFHVRCFVEPSDIEATNQLPPGPFIRRK